MCSNERNNKNKPTTKVRVIWKLFAILREKTLRLPWFR